MTAARCANSELLCVKWTVKNYKDFFGFRYPLRVPEVFLFGSPWHRGAVGT